MAPTHTSGNRDWGAYVQTHSVNFDSKNFQILTQKDQKFIRNFKLLKLVSCNLTLAKNWLAKTHFLSHYVDINSKIYMVFKKEPWSNG